MYVFVTLRFLEPSIDAKENAFDFYFTPLVSLKLLIPLVWEGDSFSVDITGFWAVWLMARYLLAGDCVTTEVFLLLRANELSGKIRVSLAVAIVGVCLPDIRELAKPINSLQVDSLFLALIDSPWWLAIARCNT